MLTTSIAASPPRDTWPDSSVWRPVQVGHLRLARRLVSTPMSRSWVTPDGDLDALRLAYLHVMRVGDEPLLRAIRRGGPGTLVVDRGRRDRSADDVEIRLADLVSLGALTLANPHLPERMEHHEPLEEPDPVVFGSGGVAGYTDHLVRTMA